MLYFIVLKNRPRLAYPVLNWPVFFFCKKKNFVTRARALRIILPGTFPGLEIIYE